MKKLLSILGTITLISTGTTFLISCSNKMTDDNEPTDEPAAAKDAKILNEISKRASNSLQKYASKKSMIDETNYDISFEKLYKMVTLTNPSVVLAIDNPDVAKILQLIRTGFNAEFENINREIINDYPNYYPTAEQLAVVENSINYQLNYIDLTQLAKITGVDVTNVNAVRLDFRFNFVVRFKSLETTVPVTISYVLTGNAKIVNDLLSGVVAKVAKPIVNYFNQIKSIKIDSNQDFEKLYDNFDIIYTNNYEELDTIVMHKLNEPIKIDDDLAPFKDKITFVDSERMLNLVSAPITEAAAGNVAGSNAVFDLVANRTTAKWSGEGFNPDQLTGQNFLNFYRSVMPIFQTSKGILQLGSFNVKLLKVQVAGFPLSGVVADNNNQNLNVSVEVSDQGLNKKLTNFGNIIAAFNESYKALTTNAMLYYIDGNDNMLYPNASYKPGVTSGGNVYWTFDYRFGVDKDSSFIYSVYSGYRTSFGIIRE